VPSDHIWALNKTRFSGAFEPCFEAFLEYVIAPYSDELGRTKVSTLVDYLGKSLEQKKYLLKSKPPRFVRLDYALDELEEKVGKLDPDLFNAVAEKGDEGLDSVTERFLAVMYRGGMKRATDAFRRSMSTMEFDKLRRHLTIGRRMVGHISRHLRACPSSDYDKMFEQFRSNLNNSVSALDSLLGLLPQMKASLCLAPIAEESPPAELVRFVSEYDKVLSKKGRKRSRHKKDIQLHATYCITFLLGLREQSKHCAHEWRLENTNWYRDSAALDIWMPRTANLVGVIGSRVARGRHRQRS